MNSDIEQLYTADLSSRTQFNDYLKRYIFMAVGIISGVNSETSLATVRTWVDDPTRVYAEYGGVEILQPAGISCPLEGALCLLMAPRTPVQTIPEITLLTTEEAYSNKVLKAIPVIPLGTTQQYGASTLDNGFSMYTPFGEIFVSPQGMGIKYSGEQGKSAITISPEGEITIANNATWVNVDAKGKISVTAEGEGITTTVEVTPESTEIKTAKTEVTPESTEIKTAKIEVTPESTEIKTAKTENDQETVLSDVTTDADGVLTVVAAEKNTIVVNGNGISITDANENKIETSSSSIKMTGPHGTLEIT